MLLNKQIDGVRGRVREGEKRLHLSIPLSLHPPLLVAILFLAASAEAATYFVDNSGSPACSNSTTFGTEAKPWCTMTYGISRIVGGDTLYVKQGTYNEYPDVTSSKSGTSAQSTVIAAYPAGAKVIIRGTGNSGHIGLTGVNWVVYEGFEVTNMNQGIFVDGGSTHVIVRNNTVHDVGQEAFHVKEFSSFVTVEGNTAYNTEKLGGCCNGEGIYIGTSSSGALDNTNNVIVRNNTIHDVSDEGIEIKPGTHDCLVEGNTVSVTNLSTDSPYAGIEINERDLSPQTWSGNPNHVVRNNLLFNNKNGIRLGTGSTAYNNVVYNTAAGFSGIQIDNLNGDSFTRTVYHNTVAMTSNGITNSGATVTSRNNIGTTGTNNLAYNAAYFVNAAARDYHLVVGAAPINAGAAVGITTDKDGNPRDSQPDIGAYEYASGGPAASACDLNSDSSTNVSDVQLCVNQALGVATCGTGDINKDTACNVIDVQRVVNAALGGACVTQ